MATDYQPIIDAVNAAILAGVDKPGSVTTSSGPVVQYRNLKDLMDTRSRYVQLLNALRRPKKGFKLTRFRAG